MANNDMELENEESTGKFERFLFLMIPIIFTLVLLGVLLTLFNMDIRNNVFAIANKIPILQNWIPDPPENASDPKNREKKQEQSSSSTIKELKSQLSKQEEALKKATDEKTAQDSKVQELENKIDTMNKDAEAAEEAKKAETEDDYLKQVKNLAKLYAGMKPSKAAPIMENLTTDEMVQIFSVMNNDSKTAILEKMDPKKAADVSIKLKEETTSSDLAIAALQSRLKQESGAGTTPPASTSKNLDKEKLNQTFSTMPPANAASLLSEMYKISPDKVITILNTVSDNVRSSILGEMTKTDGAQAAKIVNRLMGGK